MERVSAIEWNGFENYIQLFTRDTRFWQSLKVTLIFTVFYLSLNLIIGFTLALVMNQPVRGMRLFRTIYYLPAVLSGVAVAVLWSFLFHREFGALIGCWACLASSASAGSSAKVGHCPP